MRSSGDDALHQRAHRDADDRLAGFVDDRAADDRVLPEPQRDVDLPFTGAQRKAPALLADPALAIGSAHVATHRGLDPIVVFWKVGEDEAAVFVCLDAPCWRVREVGATHRSGDADNGFGHGRAGGAIDDLADDDSGT